MIYLKDKKYAVKFLCWNWASLNLERIQKVQCIIRLINVLTGYKYIQKCHQTQIYLDMYMNYCFVQKQIY